MNLSLLNSEKRTYYCEGITFLRGIACLYVICCHLFCSWYKIATGVDSVIGKILRYMVCFTQPVSETNAGVIFFIVLSGYCIHRSRSLETLSKENIRSFYFKRTARIAPVMWGGVIIGILCYLASFNNNLTEALTATYHISFLRIVLRISGINALIPFGYERTYLGNAPLTTVLVEVYLYLLYPVILYLDSKGRIIWKIVYVILWSMSLYVVIISDNFFLWWENSAFFSFFPFWYIGALANTRNKKNSLGNCYVCLFYIILFIPFQIGISRSVLILLSEIRKIIFAIIWARVIRWIDNNFKSICFPTFGIMDVGKISYSLYAVHGPFLIWLLGMKMDITTICFVLIILGALFYNFIEKKLCCIILLKYNECKSYKGKINRGE